LNSFKVNVVNLQAGGPNKVRGLAPGNPPTDKFQKIFCCLYIYIKGLIKFLCFRGMKRQLYQCLTGGNVLKNKLNVGKNKLNVGKNKLNVGKNNLEMWGKIIYNKPNVDIFLLLEYILPTLGLNKKRVLEAPLKKI